VIAVGMTPIKTYLEPELARAVSRLAEAQGRSESAVIAEAVRTRLSASAESAVKAEGEGLKRQLGRIDARLDKIVWEQMQLKECVLLFVRVWLEYNPQLDPQHEESAAASAEARFERFLDLIGNNLSSGQPLGDLDERVGVAPAANGRHAEAEAGS
jgi:predicted transcriptional regulator